MVQPLPTPGYGRVIALSFGIVGASAAALYLLSPDPTTRVEDFRRREAVGSLAGKERIEVAKDLFVFQEDSRIKIWTANAQFLTGMALLVGLLFTWQNLRATQDKLDIDREGQLTTRFTQAAQQLGTDVNGQPNIEVRLGGIYALERIARDSPRDRETALRVLCAYVKHNSPKVSREQKEATPRARPRTDIQGILTVLGRVDGSARRLDLRNCDLRGAEFYDANLEGVDFWGCDLDRAVFWGAALEGAKLERACLKNADLEKTTWRGAMMAGADLTNAFIKDADFAEASGLTKEQLAIAWPNGDKEAWKASRTQLARR